MGLRPAKSHEKPTADADWADGGADPLVRAGRPRPAAGAKDISIMQSASRPTGASAADQAVRPTIPRGWFFAPVIPDKKDGWLTDDKKRSSVPPLARRPVLRKAGEAGAVEWGDTGDQVVHGDGLA